LTAFAGFVFPALSPKTVNAVYLGWSGIMGKAQPVYPRGLDFEQVWAALMETRSRQEASTRQQEETARQMRENDERLAKRLEENDKRLTRQLEETDKRLAKQIGDLGGRFGEMIEYMVMPNLIDKFRELDFVFTKAYPEATIKDKKNRILAEIDITLENGDKVMIVEVKSKPSMKDIKDHVERMGNVRLHADLHGDRRKYLGAVAGMVIKENVREFALKTGFYVIEPSADTFTIIKPEGKYHPREW
jgi:hypothetical protein